MSALVPGLVHWKEGLVSQPYGSLCVTENMLLSITSLKGRYNINTILLHLYYYKCSLLMVNSELLCVDVFYEQF